MAFVLVVRMKVAGGNEASEHFQRLAAGEVFGLMESRERSFETVVD